MHPESGETAGPADKRLIIVDDSPSLVLQLRDFLGAEPGLQVIAMGADGAEAVELYRRHRPDLITLDLNMPNKDGLAALGEIMSEFPAARVLMISAVPSRREMLQCMRLGAKAYVEKPLLLKHAPFVRDFRASLREALES